MRTLISNLRAGFEEVDFITDLLKIYIFVGHEVAAVWHVVF
jgi:hypothetical protein